MRQQEDHVLSYDLGLQDVGVPYLLQIFQQHQRAARAHGTKLARRVVLASLHFFTFLKLSQLSLPEEVSFALPVTCGAQNPKRV